MIPVFPQFKKLELSDRKNVLAITKDFPPYSDFDFGSMWSWDFSEKMLISTLYGNLVIQFTDYLTGEYFYTFLGSNQINKTATTLLTHAKEAGIQTELKLIPESVTRELDVTLFSIENDPDNTDYVLSVNKLATYDGPELASKRRAVSQFLRHDYSHQFAEIDLTSREIQSEVRDLFVLWQTFKNEHAPASEEHEYTALNRCLKDSEYLGLISVGLFIDAELCAFWILGDLGGGYTISHFEKANTSAYQGIFPYFKKLTAQFLLAKNIKFINLEQDLGIDGLRQSKNAYAPVTFLKKYKISNIQAT